VRCGSAGVAETPANLRAVSGEFDVGWRLERRDHFVGHQVFDKFRKLRIGRRLPDEIVSREITKVSERRVAAVQKAQLHRLSNGATSATSAAPASSQRGRAPANRSFDDPLDVRLGDHRRPHPPRQ
jgi:hypothetical protein